MRPVSVKRVTSHSSGYVVSNDIVANVATNEETSSRGDKLVNLLHLTIPPQTNLTSQIARLDLGRQNCLIVLLEKRLQLKRKNKSVVIHFVVVDGAVCGVCLRSDWGLCATRALVSPYLLALLYFNFFSIFHSQWKGTPLPTLKKRVFLFSFSYFYGIHTLFSFYSLLSFLICLFSSVFSSSSIQTQRQRLWVEDVRVIRQR